MAMYSGCKSGLNCVAWRALLKDYWGQQICDLIEFGFPLNFECNCPLVSTEENDPSAIHNVKHIRANLDEELKLKAILGPFSEKPIQLHTFRLTVRDKQNLDSKRTSMDLSWPYGTSVNSGV